MKQQYMSLVNYLLSGEYPSDGPGHGDFNPCEQIFRPQISPPAPDSQSQPSPCLYFFQALSLLPFIALIYVQIIILVPQLPVSGCWLTDEGARSVEVLSGSALIMAPGISDQSEVDIFICHQPEATGADSFQPKDKAVNWHPRL